MKAKLKDVAIRSGKTFWQAAFAYIATAIGVHYSGIDVFDADALKSAVVAVIVGACAAGFSAVWNGVIAPILSSSQKASGGEASLDEGK